MRPMSGKTGGRFAALFGWVALAVAIPVAACTAQAPVRIGEVSPLNQEPAPEREPVPPANPVKSGPPDLAADLFNREPAILQRTGTSRVWAETVEAWEAPALCHRPLYFEDENLERYGRSFGLAQPAVSAAHFAGRIAVWPYLAGAFPPHECIYTLGRGRPGTYTPYGVYRPPVSLRGAIYEAGAVAGLAYLVP